MKETIQLELKKIEQENNVQILFAVEAGSRAWGFSSEDSDYDVRFVYMHPVDWYLSIHEKRDVIEYPINDVLDIHGWDIRKALRLFAKSNPALLEWIRSPIFYAKSSNLPERLQQLSKNDFDLKATIYHYLHMASKNYRECLQGERTKLKKYLNVLRPLLACKWLEEKGTLPPVEFECFITELSLEERILAEIKELLIKKKAGIELEAAPNMTVLHEFLEEQLMYYQRYVKGIEKGRGIDVEKLDGLFREIVVRNEKS